MFFGLGKMKKNSKHLPVVSILGWQLLWVAITVILLVEFGLNTKGTIGFISIIVFSVLLLLQILLIPLSVCFLWNKPIVIDYEGITQKKGGKPVKYFWVDIKNVYSLVRISPRIYLRIVIEYKDGTSIRFEPNGQISKDILFFCKNDIFLNLFKKIIQD